MTIGVLFLFSYPVIPSGENAYIEENESDNESLPWGEEEESIEKDKEAEPLIVYPLYSMLPPEKQAKVMMN